MSDTHRYQILRTTEPAGLACASLFAGAGGLALGLEHAGFHHVMLNEADRSASATLRANRPSWNVIAQDIRDTDFASFHGQVDLLEGGFPCQAFSIAGKRQGFRNIRGLLFYEFARVVNEIRPKVVMAENVKGLVTHDGGLTLKLMVAVLQALGYRAAHKVVRAQYLDVPQARARLVILAVRKDLDVPVLFPQSKDYTIPLREAVADCPPSAGAAYPADKQRIMGAVPPGGNWRDLPEDLQREYLRGNGGTATNGVARRLAWDQPCPTLLCAPYQPRIGRCHPAEARPLTIREYARIQTFPDTWTFEGGITAQYRQIGNAVPVNLGFHLGRAVVSMLTGRDTDGFEQVADLPAVSRCG